MAHIRTQLRNAVKTRLTGLTTTGANVFGNRVNPTDDAELPALLVMNDAEQITSRAIGSQVAPHARAEMRTVSLKVRALAKVSTALDDTLDQICLEVEKAIGQDIFLITGGVHLVQDSRLMSTTYELDEQGEKPSGIADMIWDFDVWVANNAPDVVI